MPVPVLLSAWADESPCASDDGCLDRALADDQCHACASVEGDLGRDEPLCQCLWLPGQGQLWWWHALCQC